VAPGTPRTWPWPDDWDAVRAAPSHHERLLENDRVQVLRTRIQPGETVPLHTHRWPSVYYVFQWSDFVRRDETGRVLVDTRSGRGSGAPPSVVWSEPLPPHTLENVGATPINLVSIEVKGPPPPDPRAGPAAKPGRSRARR
jgi:hypothetical protein